MFDLQLKKVAEEDEGEGKEVAVKKKVVTSGKCKDGRASFETTLPMLKSVH